jgi:tripeptide aminopeptidase
VSKSELLVLLRDFKTDGLTTQKEILEQIIAEVQPNYPDTKIELEIIRMYLNMLDNLEQNPKGLDFLFEAATLAGVNPFWNPIRGGTDGSRLTEMGLPTPNIFTGGQNFHSRTEWLSIDALQKSVETMIHLVQIWEQKA